MHRFIAALTLLTSFSPAPASAQTRPIFAGGSIISDDDRTNSSLTEHPVTSWSLLAGVDVTRHLAIRVLFDAPREISQTGENIYNRPPLTGPVHERYTRTRRSMTYGVAADLHAEPSRYLRLAAIAGLVTVTHDHDLVIVRHELRPDGTRVRLTDLTDRGDYDWGGILVGGEAAVRFARRLEVVPEVRVIYFFLSDSPSPYIVRPGVGVRLRF